MKRQAVRKAITLVFFLLFPLVLYYLSPYLIIAAAIQGEVSGSFMLFAGLFASALFLGRAYCGWVCPAAGLQEACFGVNDQKVRKGDGIKWIIWIPWIAGIVLAFWQAGGMQRLNPFFMTKHGVSVADAAGYITYYLVIALIVGLAFVVGRRSFCHHVCWMAPFMILGRKFGNGLKLPGLHLRAEALRCQHCHTCTQNCPMSLEVERMVGQEQMENTECILCGTCVDHCSAKAVRYYFGQK